MKTGSIIIIAGFVIIAVVFSLNPLGLSANVRHFGILKQLLLGAGAGVAAIGFAIRLVKPAWMVTKAHVANICLVAFSVIAFYLLVEFGVFPRTLKHLSLHQQTFTPPNVRIFAQSSKGDALPKNYIALVGDSYAAGMGDWFASADGARNPDFHSAHVIHRELSRDVVTFGVPGSGSLTNMALEPRRVIYPKRAKRWPLPSMILPNSSYIFLKGMMSEITSNS